MSPLHKNKYRFGIYVGNIKLRTRGYFKIDAIRKLGELGTSKGVTIKLASDITFEQRKITSEHQALLMSVARDWQNLAHFEREVRNR